MKPFNPAHRAILTTEDLKVLHRALSDKGTRSERRRMAKMLGTRSGADASAAEREAIAQYQADADHQWGRDGEIEVDCEATVSEGEDGAYVAAWVFVAKPEEDNER